MKRLALFCSFLAFFFCYLEWGNQQSAFLYEAAYAVFSKQEHAQSNFSHPLILLPFIGELILLYLVFQQKPSKRWAYVGLAFPGILVLFILLVGVLSQNLLIIGSTLPFLAAAGWVIQTYRHGEQP